MPKVLNRALASFCEESSDVNYLFPTSENLEAGFYTSEILDIQEVMTPDGDFEALDFYHRLTDSSGNVTYVRFRYYEKELPALAKELKQYPSIETLGDTIGLHEDVEIAPKKMSRYMYIAGRKAPAVTDDESSSLSDLSASSLRAQRIRSLSRTNKTPSIIRRQNLMRDDEEDIDEYADILFDEEV